MRSAGARQPYCTAERADTNSQRRLGKAWSILSHYLLSCTLYVVGITRNAKASKRQLQLRRIFAFSIFRCFVVSARHFGREIAQSVQSRCCFRLWLYPVSQPHLTLWRYIIPFFFFSLTPRFWVFAPRKSRLPAPPTPFPIRTTSSVPSRGVVLNSSALDQGERIVANRQSRNCFTTPSYLLRWKTPGFSIHRHVKWFDDGSHGHTQQLFTGSIIRTAWL